MDVFLYIHFRLFLVGDINSQNEALGELVQLKD